MFRRPCVGIDLIFCRPRSSRGPPPPTVSVECLLPKTDQRDAEDVFPYGVTLGLFGRFAGGVATDFSIWQEGGALIHQHGPLRLNLTALLLPLFPQTRPTQSPQLRQSGGRRVVTLHPPPMPLR